MYFFDSFSTAKFTTSIYYLYSKRKHPLLILWSTLRQFYVNSSVADSKNNPIIWWHRNFQGIHMKRHFWKTDWIYTNIQQVIVLGCLRFSGSFTFFFGSLNYSSLRKWIFSMEMILNTKCYIIFNTSKLHKWKIMHNFMFQELRMGVLYSASLLQLSGEKMMNYEVVTGFNFLIECRDCVYRRSFTPVGEVINIRNYVLR